MMLFIGAGPDYECQAAAAAVQWGMKTSFRRQS
jgi:hypothetical protein